MNSQINVDLRKVCSGRMTAGMLSNNFSETVQALVAKDKAYRFMNSIKEKVSPWSTCNGKTTRASNILHDSWAVQT